MEDVLLRVNKKKQRKRRKIIVIFNQKCKKKIQPNCRIEMEFEIYISFHIPYTCTHTTLTLLKKQHLNSIHFHGKNVIGSVLCALFLFFLIDCKMCIQIY